MKSMLKSRLHMAVAASLVGLAATTMTNSAQAVVAPNVSRANTGQALIYPFYTVKDGWITTFNLINTSDRALAIKVRFHEQKNSRDVLDFNIIMSPYDSWTGWVQDDPNRGPVLKTVDESCTSPLVVDGVAAREFAYVDEFDDTGGGGKNRMREGYVEVLLMGEASPTNGNFPAPPPDWDSAAAVADKNVTLYVPYHAEHVDGAPRDCTLVDKAFRATAPAWEDGDNPAIATGTLTTGGLEGSGDPAARLDFVAPSGNWLKGNVGWLNAATGYGAGSEANAVEWWNDQNYVTAQQFPWFLEPTFATGPSLWTVTGVVPFEQAVAAKATFNDWADNPQNGAQMDWVVTFPTKAYHVDRFNDQIQAALSKYRNNGNDVITCTPPEDRTSCTATTDPLPVAPFEYYFGEQGPDAEDGAGDSKITVTWDLFDREEDAAVIEVSDETTISPAPPQPIIVETLKYEANVIQFAGGSVLGASFPVDLSEVTSLVAGTSGWAKLNFPQACVPASPNCTYISDAYFGLPVSAVAIRAITRTQDGQAYDSGYEPAVVIPPVE